MCRQGNGQHPSRTPSTSSRHLESCANGLICRKAPRAEVASVHLYPLDCADLASLAALDHVARWIPSTTKWVYAIMDNLSSHCTPDVLLFVLAHPRWEMVFQPKYAADLNLIEP
jgi:hypothetical protein